MHSANGDADPLEVIEFLARSPNRVTVLQALTEGPIDRYDLEDAAGVSRATLGRILEDFAERGWVVEDDREYEATQLGEYVSMTFARTLERFDVVPDLSAVAEWFPEEGFGFDIGALADATVVRATRSNALAPTTHIADRIRGADRVRLATYSVLPDVMDACWRGAVERGLDLEGVLDGAALESVGTDADMVEQAWELVESGRSTFYVYSGDIDSTLFVVDELVLVCLSGGEGAPLAVIETDDEAVMAWAADTIENLRREGRRLDRSLFGG